MYRPPRNRALEARLVASLARERFDTNKHAAATADMTEAMFSRMLAGQAPLDLNRIGRWPWEVKRELLARLADMWWREYLEAKEAEMERRAG